MSNENYTGRNLYRVEVDTKKVNELLDRLNDDEGKKAIKSALRRSILIIRKQAQENLVSAVTGEIAKKAITVSEPISAYYRPDRYSFG